MDLADQVVRHFCHVWEIPLLAGPLRSGDRTLDPATILRTVLREGDARVIQASALWLSLCDVPISLTDEWSEMDRRRTAYLCEIARCLALLRGEPEASRPSTWPSEVAGLRPGPSPGLIALFPSSAPPVPASRFGKRWGIEEVVAFSDYAAFQRMYLDRLKGQEAA